MNNIYSYLHVTSPNKSLTYYKSFLHLQDLCRNLKSLYYKLFRQWLWIHVKYYSQLKAWYNLANAASFLLNPIKYPLTSYRKRLDSFFFLSLSLQNHQNIKGWTKLVCLFFYYILRIYDDDIILSIHVKLDHKRLYYKQLISCSYSLFGKTSALGLSVKRFSQLKCLVIKQIFCDFKL